MKAINLKRNLRPKAYVWMMNDDLVRTALSHQA